MEGRLDALVAFGKALPEETSSTSISKDLPLEYAYAVKGALVDLGINASLPENCKSKDFYSALVRDLLKVDHVQRGRVSCTFSASAAFLNYLHGLHGGSVAAVAERISIACVRTVVAETKELFLVELGVSYLAGAAMDDVLVVDASAVKSGRNLTVVAIEFRSKKTGKLLYLARATLYHMPVAKL